MQEHQGTECCLEPCLQYIYSPTEFHLLFGLLVLLGKQCGVMKKIQIVVTGQSPPFPTPHQLNI